MKGITILLLTLISLAGFAQDRQIPVNEKTGNAEFSEVVTLSGTSTADMYERAMKWIEEFYPNPTGTIQSKAEGDHIDCKARFRVKVTDKKGRVAGQATVRYKLKLEFKEGKYRYIVYDINWESSSAYDISRWENTDDPRYQEELYPGYVEQSVAYIEDLINKMTTALSTPIEEESSDW